MDRLHSYCLLLFVALIVTISVLAWRTSSGLSPDSTTYLDPAANLVQGHGLVHRWAYWDPVYDSYALPTSTTLWPPGYALVIAALAALGMAPLGAARLISLVSFSVLLFVHFLLLRLFLPPLRASVVALSLTVLFPLLPFYASVSTEPPFLLFATVALFFTCRALLAGERRDAVSLWLAASTAAGVAFLFRYVGIACVVSVGLASLWAVWQTSHSRRWSYPIAAAVPSGLVVVGVLGRNYLNSHTLNQLMPGADIFWATLFGSIKTMVTDTIGWSNFSGVARIVPLFYLALHVLLCVLAAGSFWRLMRTTEDTRTQKPPLVVSCVLALFFSLYVLVVIAGRWDNGMDVESRYVTVVLPWVFLFVIGWMLRGGGDDLQLRHDKTFAWNIPSVAFAAFLICQGLVIGRWLLNPAAETYVSLDKDSPTLAWLKAHVPAQEVILTNRGAGIALWCPNPVLMLPRVPYSHVNVENWETVDAIADRTKARVLVHFLGYPSRRWDAGQVSFLRSLDSPEQNPGRRSVVFSDAVIYQVGTTHTKPTVHDGKKTYANG